MRIADESGTIIAALQTSAVFIGNIPHPEKPDVTGARWDITLSPAQTTTLAAFAVVRIDVDVTDTAGDVWQAYGKTLPVAAFGGSPAAGPDFVYLGPEGFVVIEQAGLHGASGGEAVAAVIERVDSTGDSILSPPDFLDGVAVQYDATPSKIYVLSGQPENIDIGGGVTSPNGAFVATPGPTFTKLLTFSGYVKSGSHIEEYWVCAEQHAIQVKQVPPLATVAETGSYNDLSDTPSGGGGAQISPTPTAGQVAVWTDATTIKGSTKAYESGAYMHVGGAWIRSMYLGANYGGSPADGVSDVVFIGHQGYLKMVLGNQATLGWSQESCGTTGIGANVDTGMFRKGPGHIGFGFGYTPTVTCMISVAALVLTTYTVGTLPIAPEVNEKCSVTNALAPALYAVAAPGGSALADVKWDGSNWIVCG